VCERISAQTPWIHPESKSGSEIALNARRREGAESKRREKERGRRVKRE
jgi:hypothetical protein